MTARAAVYWAAIAANTVWLSCGREPSSKTPLRAAKDTLVVYVAASLTRPIQPILDSFSARTGAVVQRESGGSLEHARKITELHRVPDLIVLADYEVFPQLLVPAHATWYAEFARNRMVVAYTPRSRHADEINPENWTRILRHGDLEVGRSDPNVAPAGYRTLLLFRRAERHYREPGLAAILLAAAPPRNMRANAADLAALLAAGELDYIYEYQSVAEANGFRFVALPADVDLGDRILYALSIPTHAPHPEVARRFLALLFAADSRRALRATHVDLLDHPVVIGAGAPPELDVTSGR